MHQNLATLSQLRRNQLHIPPILRHQRFMTTLLAYLTILYDMNNVRILHRLESMSDGDGRPTPGGVGESLVDLDF